MVRDDVLVGVGAPLLVGAADEVDAQLRQDVGRVVQRLRQVLEPAPDQHVERPRIGGPRALDDPARSLGRLAHARVGRDVDLALLRDRAQRVRRRIAIRVAAQVRIVALVAVDHLEDVALAPRPVRRRHQAFEVEHVGVEQQVDHRLLVVGIGAADVGRDEDAMADAVERAAGPRRLLRGARAGAAQALDTARARARSRRRRASNIALILWRGVRSPAAIPSMARPPAGDKRQLSRPARRTRGPYNCRRPVPRSRQ